MTDLRKIFEHPFVYKISMRLISKSDTQDRFVSDFVKPRPGDVVLDLGCGPGSLSRLFKQQKYVGIDASSSCIGHAKKHYPAARFICGDFSDVAKILGPQSIDIIVASGLLHHLDDNQVSVLSRLSMKLLKSGGRLVTFDGCFIPNQSVFATLLLRLDRGCHVRTSEQYRGLLTNAFKRADYVLADNFLRVPYSHVIFECVKGVIS